MEIWTSLPIVVKYNIDVDPNKQKMRQKIPVQLFKPSFLLFLYFLFLQLLELASQGLRWPDELVELRNFSLSQLVKIINRGQVSPFQVNCFELRLVNLVSYILVPLFSIYTSSKLGNAVQVPHLHF